MITYIRTSATYRRRGAIDQQINRSGTVVPSAPHHGREEIDLVAIFQIELRRRLEAQQPDGSVEHEGPGAVGHVGRLLVAVKVIGCSSLRE